MISLDILGDDVDAAPEVSVPLGVRADLVLEALRRGCTKAVLI